MSIRSRRAFVRIGQRFVHYRQAGTGPVLVMLHQSPQNSRMWLEQIEWLARDYRVLAPDLPGFGDSDPLEMDQPSIADLSAACHDWLDALEIEQCAVFGMHTGGIVAVHMGLDRPDRVGLVLVDGYAIFNNDERALLGESYLPPFQPDWSGQHLRWLWARLREQSFFFPWCEQDAEFALRYPAPDTARTQAAVMDILEVGDQYRLGYRAALQFADRGCVAELSMPCRLFYREDDVLIGHRERLPDLPAHILAPRLPDKASLWAAVAEALAGWGGVAPSRQVPERPSSRESGWQRAVVDSACGEIVTWVWRPDAAFDRARLELHGPGQAPRRPALEHPEDQVLVLRPDLPGHGASSDGFDQGADTNLSLDGMADALTGLCRALAGSAALTIEAHAGSAALALALADRWPGTVESVTLIEPWLPSAGEREWLLTNLPDLAPRPAGGHLLEAWQWERERHLFPPWKPPLAEHRLPGPAPDVERVHANAVCLIGLGTRFAGVMAELVPADLAATLPARSYSIQLRFDPALDDGRLAALERQL